MSQAFAGATRSLAAGVHPHTLALLALAALAIALHADTLAASAEEWTSTDPTYQHGFAVVALSAFLYVRGALAIGSTTPLRTSIAAWVALLGMSIASTAASLTGVLFATALGLVASLALVPACLFGFRAVRAFAVPLALLLLTLPAWEPLRPLLQLASAAGAATLVGLLGVPVSREGMQIHVPVGTFEVIPGCSGMAYVLMGAIAGTLFAAMNRLRPTAAAAVVLATVASSGLGNAIRIAAVVMTGQRNGMADPIITDGHSLLGWSIFAACLFPVLFVASRLIAPAPRCDASALPASPLPASRAVLAATLACAFALVAGPLMTLSGRPGQGASPSAALVLPVAIGNWRAVASPSEYQPSFRLPSAVSAATYLGSDGTRVYVHAADYSSQTQGREAVSRSNALYDGKRWKPAQGEGRRALEGMSVHEALLASRYGGRKLVWRWYFVDGRATGSDAAAKLRSAWAHLRGDRAVAAIVLATDAGGGSEAAAEVLARFVHDARPALEAAIRDVRAAR